jgi:hypothetical protein
MGCVYTLGHQVRTTPQVGPQVVPTPAFSSCIPTGMHGPTCTFWANLTPFTLAARLQDPQQLLLRCPVLQLRYTATDGGWSQFPARGRSTLSKVQTRRVPGGERGARRQNNGPFAVSLARRLGVLHRRGLAGRGLPRGLGARRSRPLLTHCHSQSFYPILAAL